MTVVACALQLKRPTPEFWISHAATKDDAVLCTDLGSVLVQVSGTTATVVAVSGWEAVIANVGDSCAYMDTGVEVVLVSGEVTLQDTWGKRAATPHAMSLLGALQ